VSCATGPLSQLQPAAAKAALVFSSLAGGTSRRSLTRSFSRIEATSPWDTSVQAPISSAQRRGHATSHTAKRVTADSKRHRESHIPSNYPSKGTLLRLSWCLRTPAEVLPALCKGQPCLVLRARRQRRHLGLEMAGRHWRSISVFSKMRLFTQNQGGQQCSAPRLLLLVLTAPANLGHFHLPR